MKQVTDHAPNTEKTHNYNLRRAIAAGTIATATVFGVYKIVESMPEQPETPLYTTSFETLELGEGDTVIGAAINGAREIDPNLSEENQAYITEQAREHAVVQPGYEVTVRYGEYDGKPDEHGNYGTDFEVEVTPDDIK